MLWVCGVETLFAVVAESGRARRGGAASSASTSSAMRLARAAPRGTSSPRLTSRSNGCRGCRRAARAAPAYAAIVRRREELVRHEAAIGEGPQQLIETLECLRLIEPHQHALARQISLFGELHASLKRCAPPCRRHVEIDARGRSAALTARRLSQAARGGSGNPRPARSAGHWRPWRRRRSRRCRRCPCAPSAGPA